MEQPSLFPTSESPQDSQPTVVDTEAIARGGHEYDPNKPVSEAAADQGWGPVTLPDNPQPERTLFELPGKDGRQNWYNQQPTRAEVLKGKTAEEIDAQQKINKLGAAAARSMLSKPRE